MTGATKKSTKAFRPIKECIPEYLHPFVAEQDPTLYTAIDHASWRYIMRVSKPFFAKHAHQKYLDGLKETGILTERIPLISEMDACLQKFGWRAVAVVGFIPPAVFMEFLSLGLLPIACDMRRIEHLSYTPAPDIVHEAAGHAPIIADREYADYLHQYGEIARKVIFSKQDVDVYEAIRDLSDLKEDPSSSQKIIREAQDKLDRAVASVDYVSEATELARMSWWTIEYGLVGDLKNPKIYGAGLLSSVAESYHCLGGGVQKLAFDLDCVKMSYDITRPQPQLYVTKDFNELKSVLGELATTMAFRRGGAEGLQKARRAGTTTTAVFDSGIQVSGVLVDFMNDASGKVAYLNYQGPSQLSFDDVQLEGQGPEYHAQGFGTPVGKLRGLVKSPADLTDTEIEELNGFFEFESGVVVRGRVKNIVRKNGRNLVIAFENCKASFGGKVLFDPSWGIFDMACGEKVVSVFGGPADRGKFLAATGGYKQKPVRQKSNLTDDNRELASLYAKLRKIRENGGSDIRGLTEISDELERTFPDDWLLRLELLEFKGPWTASARKRLDEISKQSKDKAEMIARGLSVL